MILPERAGPAALVLARHLQNNGVGAIATPKGTGLREELQARGVMEALRTAGRGCTPESKLLVDSEHRGAIESLGGTKGGDAPRVIYD